MRLLCLLLLPCSLVLGQELLAANSQHPAAALSNKTSEDRVVSTVSAGPLHSSTDGDRFNVTGTYKGSWKRLDLDKANPLTALLEKSTGALFFRVTATDSAAEGVHNIKGELVIRDGELHSEDDLVLHMNGVYVAQSQRLHALLEPAHSTKVMLQPHDFKDRSAAYRQALQDLAHDWMQSSQGWDDLPEHELMRRFHNPMQKRCEFVLDFAVQAFHGGVQENMEAKQSAILLDGSATAKDPPSQFELPQLPWTGLPRYVQKPLGSKEGQVVMNGTLHSEACGLALEMSASSTHLDIYFKKAVRYTLMITSLCFAQILLLLPQIEATSAPVMLSKVSLLTIGQQAIMDAYLCLLHLTTGIMVDPLFNSFATSAFLEFVIFAIFEMRYLLMIWRARRSSSMDPWAQQRELSILYARFYSALLGGIFISYQLQRWMPVIVFGAFSFWIPQIVLCAYQDARQPLKAYYIIGTSLTRLALPLYLYGCPHNLLRNPTSKITCAVLAAYVACQVLVLLGQSFFGPRFFIPKRLLPPKYDYYRATVLKAGSETVADGDIETGDAGAECVICMAPVDVLTRPSRMLTPCNHVFHPACLQRWMEVKMECPTCRAQLPQI